MSTFDRLFGRDKDDKYPTAQEGIQKLREVEDLYKKKSDSLKKKIEYLRAMARRNAKNNKRAALQALKTKKNLERQLQEIDEALTTLENQKEALENSLDDAEVLKIMKSASLVLENVHKKLEVDEGNMDDAAEPEIADEAASASSNPENLSGNTIDEDELLAELQELEEADSARDLPN